MSSYHRALSHTPNERPTSAPSSRSSSTEQKPGASPKACSPNFEGSTITALAVCVESRIAAPGSITSPREMSTNASACTTSTHTSLDDTASGSATSPACPKIDFLDSSLPVGSRRKRLPGCPHFTYGRGVFQSLEKAGLTRDNWYPLAQDRGSWRSLVKRAVHNRTSSAHASPVHSLVAVQTVLGQLAPI